MITIHDIRFDDQSVPNGLRAIPEPFRRYRAEIEGFSGDYAAGILFTDGIGQTPAEGNAVRRLVAGYGNSLSLFPWTDDESTEEVREDPANAQLTSVETPTTWAGLEALSELELRAAAADLGCSDRRLGAPRLRSFLAERLGIDGPDGD